MKLTVFQGRVNQFVLNVEPILNTEANLGRWKKAQKNIFKSWTFSNWREATQEDWFLSYQLPLLTDSTFSTFYYIQYKKVWAED